MAEGYTFKKVEGARVTGIERERLAEELKRRYDSGESIRTLAAATGRSYGFIHRILTERGVNLRGRGAAGRRATALQARPSQLRVSIFLDTDNSGVARRVVRCVDELVELLGYEGPFDEEIEKGSFIRRSRAVAKKALTSSELTARLTKIERALELHTLDIKQAEVDGRSAKVVSDLIASLKDIPAACIRAGSTIIVKYEADGHPVIQARQLSQLEIRAWERFPEIQKDPSKVIETLALAVESIQEPSSGTGA